MPCTISAARSAALPVMSASQGSKLAGPLPTHLAAMSKLERVVVYGLIHTQLPPYLAVAYELEHVVARQRLQAPQHVTAVEGSVAALGRGRGREGRNKDENCRRSLFIDAVGRSGANDNNPDLTHSQKGARRVGKGDRNAWCTCPGCTCTVPRGRRSQVGADRPGPRLWQWFWHGVATRVHSSPMHPTDNIVEHICENQQ